MNVGFSIRYAFRSLLRDGQRTLLAMVCVTFGVMSLVALQQLSAIIDEAFLLSPRMQSGGDLVLSRSDRAITAEDTAGLSDLGIDAWTGFTRVPAQLLRTTRSGEVIFLSSVLAVDPASFPLLGTVRMRDDAVLRDVLAQPNGAVVTRDLADRLALVSGDSLALAGSPGSPPFYLTVAGVAEQTPSRQGGSVLMSLATARQHGFPNLTTIAVRHDAPDSAATALEAAGWTASVVPLEPRSDAADIFGFMLAGSGILGLLIGGIGVANTMQVLLARRTDEIATLKALGYQKGHLLRLFGMEALLIGLGGGIAGVALGLALASGFMHLLMATVPFLLDYRVDVGILAGGVFVGVLTAMIFGLVAIVRASEVRPALLLRGLDVPMQQLERAKVFGLYGMLLMLFGGLSSVVLGSTLQGFGVVAAGLVGLLVLGLVLGGVLWLVVRLPLPGAPLLRMARRNLRHQPLRVIYGLVALFVGTFAIGFAAVTLLNAMGQRSVRSLDLSGLNTYVYAERPQEAALTDTLAALGATEQRVSYLATVRVGRIDSTLEAASVTGRIRSAMTGDVTLSDSLGIAPEHAAFMPDWQSRRSGLQLGDTLVFATALATDTLRFAGTYTPAIGPASTIAPRNWLVDASVAQHLGGPTAAITLNAAVPEATLEAATRQLGRAFPSAVVFSSATISEAINRLFLGLFWFVMAVAGLALVAGAVLIANAVGLAMLERQRELGVLKAVGYSSRAVLITVLLENALLGFIGGLMGVLGLYLFIPIINLRFPSAGLTLPPSQAALLILVAMLFAVVSALAVAWTPTQERPLTVLRRG